jgi:hypothetical protein
VPGRSALPATVVRFYGNVDYALDTIAHRQIIFIHVSKLNDPFDPYFFFETDFDGTYEQLFSWVQKHRPNDCSWFVQHVTNDGWNKSVADIEQHVQALRNTSFVFSTSAVMNEAHPKDSLYMWGHYGNGHRGAALEFDLRKIALLITEKHNKEKGVNLQPETAWVRIEYEAKMPPITRKDFFEFFLSDFEQRGRRTALEKYYDKTSRVKSLAWKRENEWRMLWRNDETRLKVHRTEIPVEAIKAVYLGLAMSSGYEADIIFEGRGKFPNAKIYKAHKKAGFTQLDFTEVTT